VVAVFAVVTVVRSFQVGIPLRDPHGSIWWTRIGISVAMFVVYAVALAAWQTWRHGLGRSGLVPLLRERWTASRLASALALLLAYHVTYFCYHNLKSWDVYNKPRDQMLLDWDRWLFLGHSPAVLLHDLLGTHYATYVLLVIYESFSTMVLFAIAAPVALVPRLREAAVGIASGVWIWILGTASYYAIPSLGPFWSAPQEFSALPHTMIQDTQARYLGQRAHLLAHPHAPDAFAQISAFASLHVGVTTVLVLMARYYGLTKIYRALCVFLVGTLVATTYLGWHFFVDDIAGLAIGWLACWLGLRTIKPRRAQR
jgi:hypothetical protein